MARNQDRGDGAQAGESEVRPEDPAVAGVFPDEASAEEAVQALLEAGFDGSRDISVIEAHHREHEEVPVPWRTGILPGIEFGASIGAVLGASGAVAVASGVIAGPVVLLAAGPIAAALAGGATGGLAGGLAGMGLWWEEPDFEAAEVEGGVVWVGVHAEGDRIDLAHDILAEAGAAHFTPTETPEAEPA